MLVNLRRTLTAELCHRALCETKTCQISKVQTKQGTSMLDINLLNLNQTTDSVCGNYRIFNLNSNFRVVFMHFLSAT